MQEILKAENIKPYDVIWSKTYKKWVTVATVTLYRDRVSIIGEDAEDIDVHKDIEISRRNNMVRTVYKIYKLERGLLIEPQELFQSRYSSWGYRTLEEAQEAIIEKRDYECVILPVTSYVED